MADSQQPHLNVIPRDYTLILPRDMPQDLQNIRRVLPGERKMEDRSQGKQKTCWEKFNGWTRRKDGKMRST